MTPRKSFLQQQQPSWRKSFHCILSLTVLVYTSCTITKIPLVDARTPSAAAAAVARSALSTALRQNNDASLDTTLPKSSSRWGSSHGLSHIIQASFVQKRSSSSSLTLSRNLKKDIDIEWSISTGHVMTKIRGGSASESEDESEEEYDEEEEEEESTDDEYDSDDEYETESEGEEYDSDQEEEEEEEVSTTQSSKKSTSLKSSLLSKSQDPSKEEVAEYDDLLTPPAMQQFAVSIGVMMLANRIDITNSKAVRIARFAFLAYIISVQVFLLYVHFRAKSIDDRTCITISNPLGSLASSLVPNNGGGAAGGGMVKALADQVLSSQTTVLEYDLKQVKKMNGGLLFPMVLLYFLHFRMKQVQPLLMQTATGVLNLVYSPLFQVYVLGRNLERPFKPPANPMMEALQKQDGEEEEGDGDDAVVSEEENGEEEEDGDDEEGGSSEDEEEEASEEEEESDEYDSDEE
eukprot:CAMPEP_0172303898 /NCGR_PEP_ID=MMETSP1058-20130122/5405_1 /TAXON_ID=83371 /ORGANISM="Detonula confervacea, Strain CCMP 353" /LENGTH=461 /DNA_ID=CAMNT_0013014935 /DNA_START=76 /DNA_END=1461 /DNA_ORIENTATION=-